MSTYRPAVRLLRPRGRPLVASDPVVGQVPESAQDTAAVERRRPRPVRAAESGGAASPLTGWQAGATRRPATARGYGQPGTASPGYGAARPAADRRDARHGLRPPPAPRKRGWIGWLARRASPLVVVAGIVGAVVLLSGGGTLIGVSSAQVAIPDASPTGVTSAITLDGSGAVQNVHVEADDHPPLHLRPHRPPDLARRARRSTVANPATCTRADPNLAVNLDSATPGSPLAPLVGQAAGGEWRLQVVDGVGIDQGTLQPGA